MNKLAELIANKPVHYAENPHWFFNQNEQQIYNRHTNQSLLGDDFSNIRALLPTLIDFFQQNYNAFQCESQVLLLTQSDYQKINHQIPTLNLDMKLSFAGEALVIAVLPQHNTWSNTTVSEVFWQNEMVNKGVVPIARIHTHHILNAYQSYTDWSTLNSGTLELVIGKIYDSKPEIAFWLDKRGSNQKDIVFHSFNQGLTVEKIKAGYQRVLKASPKNLSEAKLDSDTYK